MDKIYYERQRNGLCRMHVINAYFGKRVITENMFRKYMINYDLMMIKKYNSNISCSDFDIMWCNLVSYILNKNNIITRNYCFNEIYNKPLDVTIKGSSFIFIYNSNHIWGIKKYKNVYYKVDSIGGVSLFNISSLNKLKNIGLIVTTNRINEWNRNKDIIYQELKSNNALNINGARAYIKKINKNKMILGDLEIPLNNCIRILEISKNKPQLITKLLKKYDEFYKLFINKNYNNTNLVMKYIPDILISIIKLH